MSWASEVPPGATVLVDTNPIVYMLEGHALARAFEPLFAAIDKLEIFGMITPITLAEVVTGPIAAGKEALAERYRTTLTLGNGWRMMDINDDVAVLAARFRIRYGLRLPDAIQLGAAVCGGCYGIVTHDRDFSRVDELPVFGV